MKKPIDDNSQVSMGWAIYSIVLTLVVIGWWVIHWPESIIENAE